ncbi:hypothetical protein FJR41_015570 [Dolichospermum planctonicum UHCC 0167]|jgi:hypothetical protein|uniref:hypothetical protein n=1 Tax=Dolichospermum planctonicum TaxID=136072 RepID=UPI00144358AF|nr:hypothetical protein [Dolichospermum planctonicum]MCW9682196.1 hypothetical protein [Dolichospermum planctonicum UHCC 0167]
MYTLRNKIASCSRSTPYIRGKFRLGKIISDLLSNYNSENMLLTPVEISDSVLTKLGVLGV